MGKEVGDMSYRDEPGAAPIYAVLDKMKSIRAKMHEGLLLGQLIEKLKTCDPKGVVTIEPFRLIPADWDSYRGYYEDLALDYSLHGEKTVETFLKECEACIGKVFTGYKGGDFEMDAATIIWVSKYSLCSDMAITDVKVWGEKGKYQYVELVTKKIDD